MRNCSGVTESGGASASIYHKELKGDVVRIPELQHRRTTEVFDRTVGHAEAVEVVRSGLQRLTVRDGETQVIQTHPVLVEAVLGRRDGAKPEQTGAEAVDHPAAQKRQLLTRLLVGV